MVWYRTMVPYQHSHEGKEAPGRTPSLACRRWGRLGIPRCHTTMWYHHHTIALYHHQHHMRQRSAIFTYHIFVTDVPLEPCMLL